jgi:O-antigen ligase
MGPGIPAQLKTRAQQLLPWAFGLWAVGAQVNEVPATVGAWATALLALLYVVFDTRVMNWRRYIVLFSFVACMLLAPMFAGHMPSGAGVARALDFLLIPGAAVAISVLSAGELVAIATAAALTLMFSTLIAGFQYFGMWPDESTFASLAWTKLSFARVYETVPGREDRFMAGGLLLHRLKYANVSAVFVVLGATAAGLRVPRWRLFALATLVGFFGVFIFPHARAASVALVCSMAVVWIASAKNKRRASIAASILLLVAVAVASSVPSVRMRFENVLSSEGSGERTSITHAGLNAVKSSPMAGVGLGRFRPGLYLGPEAPAQAREHPGKAHNQFVTIAAESGLFAVALLVMLLLMSLSRGIKNLPAGAFAVGATVLFVLLGMFHDPLFHAESSFALMLLLGIGIGAVDRMKRASP